MIRRAKNWVLRKARPLIQEAAGPAVEAAARDALQAMLPPLRQTVEESLKQATGDSMASVAAAAEASMKAAEAAAQDAVRSTQALAQPLMERLQAAQAEFLAGIEEAHARQVRLLADQGSASMRRVERALHGQLAFSAGHPLLLEQLTRAQEQFRPGMRPALDLPARVRAEVRKYAGLPLQPREDDSEEDLLAELRFLWTNSVLVRPLLALCAGKRVLYSGQCYYNLWYLSRALRARGWKADLLNWDGDPATQIYYHGEDFRFAGQPDEALQTLRFYVASLYGYDVFHFSNAHGMTFGWPMAALVAPLLGDHGEIHLLKALGKKVAYTNNGCLDGVSQTSFSRWGAEPVCAICRWRDEPSVCSDERNLRWGSLRNSVADYQCLLGGNRADYNDDPRVHEAPWVYCMDSEVWRPDLDIPERFRIPRRSERTLLLYHAVGHRGDRTLEDGVNIKSSHTYLPLIDKLKGQGWDIELLEPEGVPNRDVRYLQLQADVFLEMLTYGWFGANAREAMMLGKPVICYIRPEWLDSLREELPEYARDLPIVSATPDTVEDVLVDLLSNPAKRAEIGRRGREFMLHWHSSEAAAREFDRIYSGLIAGSPLLRPPRLVPAPGAIRVLRT
ncbi:glycosyltransferase [Ramlibacter sp. AN1133]|uniref:glycosyltransferase n=1 Tax=Ramlibacter sp. AN1133 TaxID=3133429 RepID=UPI0030BFABC1